MRNGLKGQGLQNVNLPDVTAMQPDGNIIKYNDGELVLVDNLRDIPDFTASKLGFNVVAACTSGRLQVDVSGVPVTVGAQQVFICHSHMVLSNIMISPDFECKVMCVSDRLLQGILQSQMRVWSNIIYKKHWCILNIPAQRFGLYGELSYQWSLDDHPFRHEIIVSLLRVMLLELCRQLIETEKADEDALPAEGGTRMETIFHRFQENIARRHIKKVSVAEYAEELCITPKYLSTICRTVSGKSPTEWISEYVVQDITYYLRNTDLTAKEIANELGFQNSSFFGKYVKEYFGMSPMKFREAALHN